MANAAIEKRRQILIDRGFDPGGDLGPELVTSKRVEQPTEFGTFVAYPGQEEAWFYADAENAWRFRPPPG